MTNTRCSNVTVRKEIKIDSINKVSSIIVQSVNVNEKLDLILRATTF